MLFALCVATSGLLPTTTVPHATSPVVAWSARASPQMNLDRRQIVAAALAAAPMAAKAAVQVNDNAYSASNAYLGDRDYTSGSDDAMARIAAKTTAANEAAKAARVRAPPTGAELLAKQEESKNKILLVAVGGSALSIPFFFKNLQRLATKVATGGQDSGYGSAKDQAFR